MFEQLAGIPAICVRSFRRFCRRPPEPFRSLFPDLSVNRWLNRWFNRSLKKLSEKRSYYSDTPGKFVLLKELKRKFLQIFFVDNFYFCSFVAENVRFNQRLNQRKIIPSVFATFLSVLSLFLSWPCLFPYSGCGISRTYPARCRNACIYR